jgi:YD repeat-containing protein
MQVCSCLICLKNIFSLVVFFSSVFITTPSRAQSDTFYTEQNKLIRAPQAYTRLGADLFGDKVNLYTGSLEFIQTDVSIPGNNMLPVSVGRRLATGIDAINGALFGRWDLEIPHLHGIFSTTRGWETTKNTKARCTDFSPPPLVSTAGPAYWSAEEYWRGSFLYVPGHGDQEMLVRASLSDKPSDSEAYPIITRNNWVIRCLPNMATGNTETGEGFVAVSPDGTQYRFDWMVKRNISSLLKPNPWPEFRKADGTSGAPEDAATTSVVSEEASGQLPSIVQRIPATPQLNRTEFWILPTLVTDKYGNSVRYSYDATNQWQLLQIDAQDGSYRRQLNLNYVTPSSIVSNLVSSVTDGTRTWSYNYDGSDKDASLQKVTLPDGSAWELGGIAPLVEGIRYFSDGSCEEPGFVGSFAVSGSMKHPSGADGQFTLTPVRHGRSNVHENCAYDSRQNTYTPVDSKMFDTMALTTKTIGGPGLTGLTWETAYPPASPSWAPCNDCNDKKTVSVTDPEGGVTSHTFSTRFQDTEGRLLSVAVASKTGEQLRNTSMRYYEPIKPFGASLLRRGDSFVAAKVQEVDQRIIEQQGILFTWEATAFDRFAHPTTVLRSNTLGDSRSETTIYEDNLSKWVIGQVKQVTGTANGKTKVMQLNGYDPRTSSLLNVSNFGQLQRSMTYYDDGTLHTLADSKGQTTTFTEYKRGIPQTILYPDRTTKMASIDDRGLILALTDENGITSGFDYDEMGRLSSVIYPTEDWVAWQRVKISFKPAAAKGGLGEGHWRQEITVGDAVTSIDFDAFWRPVYTEKWDKTNISDTLRITQNSYDSAGRDTYVSYPQRKENELGPGVYSQYDALGRLTETRATSERGDLYTRTYYDSNFRTTVTNPRGYSSSYYHQAFDDPVKSQIRKITMPLGISVDIQRDGFDKPTSIARSGTGVSVNRRYVYDNAERLCKTIEPEVGATVQDYDSAGNIAWRGTGLKLPLTDTCDISNVPEARKTSFRYDARNRLLDTTFGDNKPGVFRILTRDGLPDTVTSGLTAWKYLYNKRRLLRVESLSYGSGLYPISYEYDANGSLSKLIYPQSSLEINYKPNALGEATQIGGYATDIKYHPNGAVKGFVYGNGIRRSMSQNSRGLPENATDSNVLGENYTYDENANVQTIRDVNNIATRTMEYDDLDRMMKVSAPGLWGTARYDYDAVDNLTGTTIDSGATARSTVHVINPTTNRLDRIENGPAAFNFSYGYDDQGNVTRRGTQIYTFDLANRLIEATDRSTYVYDGLGRRVSTVSTDGVNRVQVYNQSGQLLYMTGGGSNTRYIYLNRHVIAEVKQ